MRAKQSIGVIAGITLLFWGVSFRCEDVGSYVIATAEAQGNSANAPGRSGEAPGNSANAPGRSGEAPGNSANAPGRSGEAPGNSANAPGRSGEAPGNSANAPGRSGDAPGNSANAPGRSGGGAASRGRASGGAGTAGPGSVIEQILGGGQSRTDAAPATPQPEPPQAATAPRIVPRFRPADEPQGSESFRGNEVAVVGLDAARRNALSAAGFATIATRNSSILGNRQVTRLATPPGISPGEAAALVRQTFPDTIADLSHLYRPAAQPTSVRYAQQLIGVDRARCVVGTRIGLVDTGVGEHEALRRARLTRRAFVDLRTGGNPAHGTAVASLLVGDLPGVEPLVPGSRIYSANVFAGVQGVLAGDVTAIIEALDWMAANRVQVVNLSLIGPPNELLEAAALGAAQKGMILVAAGGNDGPSAPPAYPAAYPTVIAVSAVDERGRPYSNNNRGRYVEIAAPGVDIWAASAEGGAAFWTGTSFAVPFVTAALAREAAAGTVSDINDARSYLRASARDLGARGRDPVYGYGLLQARNCAR